MGARSILAVSAAVAAAALIYYISRTAAPSSTAPARTAESAAVESRSVALASPREEATIRKATENARAAANGESENAKICIRGTVVDHTGAPVPNAVVQILETKVKMELDNSPFPVQHSTPPTQQLLRAGAKGEFTIESLKSGVDYSLFTFPEQNITFDFRRQKPDTGTIVAAPADSVKLVLNIPGLDLELIAPADNPEIFSNDGSMTGHLFYLIEKDGNKSNGEFMGQLKRHTVVAVDPGSLVSLILKTSYRPVVIKNIAISGNGGMEQVRGDLVRWAGNSVTLVPRGNDGAVVKRAIVVDITNLPPAGLWQLLNSPWKSNEAGEFILQNLPPGENVILVIPDESSGCVPAQVSVDAPDAGGARKEVILEKGGTLTIRATGEKGSIWVPVLYKSGDENDYDKSILCHYHSAGERGGSGFMHAGNQYTLNRALEPGSYVLVQFRRETPKVEFTIRKGERTEIEVQIPKDEH